MRVGLERRIEERLAQTEAGQDERIMAAVREELTAELDRWGQDLMDRMDILLGASGRLVASLEARLASVEHQLRAVSVDPTGNGVPPASSGGPGAVASSRDKFSPASASVGSEPPP